MTSPNFRPEDATTPRICPVTGMFLDEPAEGTDVFHHWNGDIQPDIWENTGGDKMRFEIGNLFATRQDAERYAKHLKAMAKLRRYDSGKTTMYRPDGFLHWIVICLGSNAIDQLTPEEQNALLWPNEDK